MFVYLITPGSSFMLLILLFDTFLEGGDDVVFGEPTVASSDFQLDKIVDGLSRPTGLTFLGPGEFIGHTLF